MGQNFINKNIIKILEEKYKVNIEYRNESDVDCAFSAGNDVYLLKYSNIKIEIICLCHELAHCVLGDKFQGKYHISVLSKEGAAWEETINVIKDNENLFGINLDIDNPNSDEYKFMKKCFLSYVKKEYM
jgi:hypothetical protein